MKEWSEEDQERAEQLTREGYALLQDGEFSRALKIARKLERLNYSSAFEIAAQAQAALGRMEDAIRTLERGLAKGPGIWLNWQLLGNYLSDSGEYDRAEKAYLQAMGCEGVWIDSVQLNLAVLRGRAGSLDEALTMLEEVQDPKLDIQAEAIRVSLLNELERYDEVVSRTADHQNRQWLYPDQASLLRILMYRAWALYHTGAPVDQVRHFAVEVIRETGSDAYLFALVRTMDNLEREVAHLRRLEVQVKPGPAGEGAEEAENFLVLYEMIMETEIQALTWIREIEGIENLDVEIRILSNELLEILRDEALGVTWRSGRVYFSEGA